VGETGLKRHVLVENVGSPTGLVGDRRVRADGRRRDRKAAQRRGCARIDEPIARPSRLTNNRPAGEVAGLKSRRWSRLPPSRPQEQSRRGPLPPRGRQPTGGFAWGTPFSRVQCPALRGLQPSGVRVNLKRPFAHLRHRFLRTWGPATPRKLSAVAIPRRTKSTCSCDIAPPSIRLRSVTGKAQGREPSPRPLSGVAL
jgi:hypothetical protein